MNDLRYWMKLLEAGVGRQPTFAAIAKYPDKYVQEFLEYAKDRARRGFNRPPSYVDDHAIAVKMQASANNFLKHIKNGKMILYRGMQVPGHWNPVSRGLGVHWSTSREAATDFAEQSRPYYGIIIQATVGIGDIDTWFTIELDFMTTRVEKEVRVLPTATILINDITHEGEKILPQYVGQTYPADRR